MGNLPVASAPVPHWANLFNFYVTDPLSDTNLKDKAIPVVERLNNGPRNRWGLVSRDCSDLLPPKVGHVNHKRLYKFPRQGQFDNIHIAPHMTVKTVFERVTINQGLPPFPVVNFQSYAKWKMDDVVMAPFCAHDCFHMHWRWTDNANTEQATYGWGATEPYVAVGAPMVPLNQDVFIVILEKHGFSYLAQAHDVPKNGWQPFCHHGGAYAVAMKPPALAAKQQMSLIDGMVFQAGNVGHGLEVEGGWALFYWRMRYRLKPVPRTMSPALGVLDWDAVVEERFSFTDEPAALTL
jgi:hypothetical protein